MKLQINIFIIYRGQFAIVRKCMEIKTGEFYAAKIMRKRRVARGVAAEDIGRYFCIFDNIFLV